MFLPLTHIRGNISMSKEIMESSGSLEVVDLGKLQIDETYQRSLLAHHKRMVKQFDPHACEPLTVGRRQDKSLWVIDGQQRRETLMKLGYSKWRALVIDSTGPAFEAHLFQVLGGGLGTVKPLNTYDVYKAQLASGDEIALKMKFVAEKYGFKMADYKGTRYPHISGVKGIYFHVKTYGTEFLDKALRTIQRSWPEDPNSCYYPIIMGIVTFYKTFPTSDEDRLVQKLQKMVPLTPVQMVKSGGGAWTQASGHMIVTNEIVARYNKQLADKNKLKLVSEAS